MPALITNIYVDGFNLYYGALKGTPYKWLDLGAFCRRLLPADQYAVHRIRYYTAFVRGRPHDPDQPIRQRVYLRALRTIPGLDVYLGHFLSSRKRVMLADGSGCVEAVVESEKGTDVNLASHLVRDGFVGDYQCAVVISNDTDLLEPIRIVREELGKEVGVVSPYPKQNLQLKAAGTFAKRVLPWALKRCQFPDVLTDAAGTFRKPATW